MISLLENNSSTGAFQAPIYSGEKVDTSSMKMLVRTVNPGQTVITRTFVLS